MAKVGTAHIEIKPVVSDDALEKITQSIADAIERGIERANVLPGSVINITNVSECVTAEEAQRLTRVVMKHMSDTVKP